jgi:Methyltransferase TYW3
MQQKLAWCEAVPRSNCSTQESYCFLAVRGREQIQNEAGQSQNVDPSVKPRTLLMTVFDQRKKHILQDLESGEPDLSPKGKPDDEILELLELLNTHEDYVSTSSCSGRAVVYLDGNKHGEGEESRGRWLMNRHKPFEAELLDAEAGTLYSTIFGEFIVGEEVKSYITPSRPVSFKFEPLVCISGFV